MNQGEAINKLLKDNNKTKVWMAEKLGYNSSSGVSNMLARKAINLDTLLRMCEILEYEITIQPKRRSGVRPQGQIVIDRGQEK